MKKISVETSKHTFVIECHHEFIKINDVKTDKELFLRMCQNGCKNFNNKYSCPPFSPSFEKVTVGCKNMLVIMLKMDTSQADKYNEYHRLRIGNAILKSRIEKIMRNLETRTGGKYIGTGSCGLCRPCQKKLNKPCKYPDRMRYSLESLGVDCNNLAKKLFGKELFWFRNGKAPTYTSVICGLPLKNMTKKQDVIEELKKILVNI